MKILVTGANGFVGRHLLGGLLASGHEVVGTDTSGDGIPAGARMVVGDLGDAMLRREAIAGGCDAVVHLATVPGGAAEADPATSRRINIDATYDLLEEAGAARPGVRVVYASSIAVYGDPLPAAGVDDGTPLSPRMTYGGHKAMMETAIAMLSNRGVIDGVSLRLSGILARPKGPSGMKSAFMSNLFHALAGNAPFVCPVSQKATIWAQSVERCVANLTHALTCDTPLLPPTRAVTLPALRIAMGDLALEIASQCGASAALVSYQPDIALEAAFGAHPMLSTPAAERAGLAGDANLGSLVSIALKTLS
ncbi:epimerase [Novosphingobium sp. AAP83]|uniref:NAD-dependent epimerase/dehydratase family protein n=1 Tax=Novosphingobium sp. AAP83 TaxID=1523425 RepID=UPI0006B8FD86|nr:NAD-dependent epimerase/dehydratase family protein [Novosphingobium sp. AAP83]KPF87929.1 epimerase [Novosphingobium sp. AAP83]